MSLNDIERAARASRTDAELYALVEAIYESPPPTQERNWLEWKGSLDLTTADGRFAVAKAILGFANRSVAQAELVCEGVAYMVVGVEPGAAVGIPVIDHATLSDKIKKYADTPRWSAHYVEFRGVTVLVIVVERPAGGDPIHTLQSPYSSNQRTSGDGRSGHYAGTVFHRGLAQTAPAGPKEIVMLTERAVQGALRPDLLLTMTAAAEPLTRINISPQQVEEWLTRREAYVRAHSGKPPDPPPPSPPQTTNPMLGRFGGLAGLGDVGRISANLGLTRSQYAEPEDAQEFERRVAGYKVDVRQRKQRVSGV